MIALSLGQIAVATSGKLMIRGTGAPVSGLADAPSAINTVSTDSRDIAPGSLFIALKGDRFDAHDFLPQVASAGAGAIIADRPDKTATLNIPCILVPNTRKALGQLASHVRDLLACRVIAIGGSNGKTTTKHLVGSVLSSAFKGTQSPKSFNNDIGVPLTILGAAADDAYVVLELGTNHPGELSPLSTMSRPDIAVITSIGAEHLEGFGDLDGVRREEACLIDGLKAGGRLYLNGDDPPLLEIARKTRHRMITFGFTSGNDLRIDHVDCSLEGIRFTVAGVPEAFFLPLPGRHNASNALAAILIGREMGMTDSAIRDALANCSRPEMRMQIMQAGTITILNDAYNANPASMKAALETIASATLPGRRIAVLGEMRELGDSSASMHRDIGRLAWEAKLDCLVCVGAATSEIASAAIAAGMNSEKVYHSQSSADAATLVRSLLLDHDTLLLKGSRGVKLELVAQAVAQTQDLRK